MCVSAYMICSSVYLKEEKIVFSGVLHFIFIRQMGVHLAQAVQIGTTNL